MGSAVGPWLNDLGHACHQELSKGRRDSRSARPTRWPPLLPRWRGGGGSLSASQLLLLPAEDLRELAQLLTGRL